MDDGELIRRYLAGEKLKEIAAAAGCNPQKVANRLQPYRDTLPYRKRPLSPEDPRRQLATARKELVIELAQQGVPVAEIAARVGLHKNRVYLIAKGHLRDYQPEIERIRSQLQKPVIEAPKTL